MIKKTIIVLIEVAVLAASGILFFFYRFYQNDMRKLENFAASYEKYDRAISDLSAVVTAPNFGSSPAADDLERKADAALVDLNANASIKISSMIKNEKEAMRTTMEIAGISTKEFEALKAYRAADANKAVHLDTLLKAFADLTKQRQTAYTYFQSLGK